MLSNSSNAAALMWAVMCLVPSMALASIKCADEGLNCQTPKASIVLYGAQSNWVVKPVTGASITCDSSTFGRDPLPGVRKQCFSVPFEQVPVCAAESGTCNTAALSIVAYGADIRYNVQLRDKGAIRCSNETFGDPADRVVKQCRMVLVSLVTQGGAASQNGAGTAAGRTDAGSLAALPFDINSVAQTSTDQADGANTAYLPARLAVDGDTRTFSATGSGQEERWSAKLLKLSVITRVSLLSASGYSPTNPGWSAEPRVSVNNVGSVVRSMAMTAASATPKYSAKDSLRGATIELWSSGRMVANRTLTDAEFEESKGYTVNFPQVGADEIRIRNSPNRSLQLGEVTAYGLEAVSRTSAAQGPRPKSDSDGEEFYWSASYGRGVGIVPPLQCRDGEDLDAGLCYPKCNAGFHGVATACWNNDGLSYGRGAGSAAIVDWAIWYGVPYIAGQKCWGSLELNGALCYERCRAGFHGVGPVCWINQATYDRGVGRAAALVCPESSDSNAGLCYANCGAGFYGVGPVCWSKSPPGYVSCGAGHAKDSSTCGEVTASQVIAALTFTAQACEVTDFPPCTIALGAMNTAANSARSLAIVTKGAAARRLVMEKALRQAVVLSDQMGAIMRKIVSLELAPDVAIKRAKALATAFLKVLRDERLLDAIDNVVGLGKSGKEIMEGSRPANEADIVRLTANCISGLMILYQIDNPALAVNPQYQFAAATADAIASYAYPIYGQ